MALARSEARDPERTTQDPVVYESPVIAQVATGPPTGGPQRVKQNATAQYCPAGHEPSIQKLLSSLKHTPRCEKHLGHPTGAQSSTPSTHG